jgi:regulator of protease activity HflC (stomatin/prohibitin superfamily)
MAAEAASDPISGLTGVPSSTWLLVGLLLASFTVVASLRVVPERSRLVVSRLGQVTRVAGPGLVLRVPGLEQVAEVSLQPERVDLVAPATTVDGVRVRLHAEALVQVTRPGLTGWLGDPRDPHTAAATEVEAVLVRETAHRELAELLSHRADLERAAAGEASAVSKAWGVEVLEVTVLDVDATLTVELVRGLGHRGTLDRSLPGPP